MKRSMSKERIIIGEFTFIFQVLSIMDDLEESGLSNRLTSWWWGLVVG